MTATAFLPAQPSPPRRLSPVTGLRNSFTLTWRSVLKLRTNPEDLFGLLLQPIMYLVLFTYVFGGSIAGGTHQYLESRCRASWCSPWCSPRSAPA